MKDFTKVTFELTNGDIERFDAKDYEGFSVVSDELGVGIWHEGGLIHIPSHAIHKIEFAY